MKAIALFSGGIDSYVAAARAQEESIEIVRALFFTYGQPTARKEWACACDQALELKVTIELPITINLVPPHIHDIKTGAMYIPCRNLVFLACAANVAERYKADRIIIGAHYQDFGGYPDCRPKFFNMFELLMQEAYGSNLRIYAPLLNYDKKQIIYLGTQLGCKFNKTWSCYQNDDKPCRTCDSCKLRAQAFKDLAIEDSL